MVASAAPAAPIRNPPTSNTGCPVLGAYQLVTFLSCVDELAYSVLSGVEEIPMERLLPMTKWRGESEERKIV